MEGGPEAGGWNGVDSLRRCQARAPSAASERAAAAGLASEDPEAGPGPERFGEDAASKPKSNRAADAVVGVCCGGAPRHCTDELAADEEDEGPDADDVGGCGGLGSAGPDLTSPIRVSYSVSRSDVGDLSRECKPECWMRPPDSSAGVVGTISLKSVATPRSTALSSLDFARPGFVSMALGTGRRGCRFLFCCLPCFCSAPCACVSLSSSRCFFRL